MENTLLAVALLPVESVGAGVVADGTTVSVESLPAAVVFGAEDDGAVEAALEDSTVIVVSASTYKEQTNIS